MSSDSDKEDTGIDVILQQIGLQQYAAAFEANKISIEHVEIMTEEDFRKLGVNEMGTRLKIKQACRNFLKGNQSSPVVKVFKTLSKKKKSSNVRRNHPRNEKPTRRIYVGWKHKFASGLYKVIAASKGGGQQVIDIDKNCSYADLVKIMVERYFPDGRSKWQNLEIEKLTYFVGTYTGEPVPTMEEKGGFTVAKYFQSLKAYPVRLYLHTESVSETHDVEDESNEHDVSEENVTQTLGEQTVSHTVEEELPDIPGCSSFLDADTPTVQFNANRLRLSLSKRRIDRQEYRSLPREEESVYRSVSEVIEVCDSEDEELQRALHASLHQEQSRETGARTEPADEMPDLQALLRDFQMRAVNKDNVYKLLVMRSKILETAFKGMDKKKLNLKATLYIKFSGESGEDQGGPRREFFRLLMKELQDSRFFEGPETAKVFSHNLIALEKEHYRFIGRLVALSLAQDGPGMKFLSPDLYDAMVGKPGEMKDVELPENIKLMIQKLRNADNPQEIDCFLSNYFDQLLDCGITNAYQMAREQKDTLVQIIIKHHIFYRTAGEVSQFVNGMNDVSKCWEMVGANSETFKPLFCYNKNEVTVQEFLRLFKVNYSELGSNHRTSEDITIYGWEAFLQSIEEGEIDVSLSEVMSFVTGADSIPPCGFTKDIDIDFYSDDGRLPSVSTCALQLWLPRVSDPDIILNMMIRAIRESFGFLKV